MTESLRHSSNHEGFVRSPTSDLLIPDRNLLDLDEKEITLEDLHHIFKEDVGLLFQDLLRKKNIISADRKIELFKKSKRHIYKTEDKDGIIAIVKSGAHYFFEEIIGDDAVMAYLLLPESFSSAHQHDDRIKEIHYGVAGKFWSRPYPSPLKAGMEHAIPSYTIHQTSTKKGEYAFVGIIMKNAALIPRNEWHQPTTGHH